jgi:hypothetical protein
MRHKNAIGHAKCKPRSPGREPLRPERCEECDVQAELSLWEGVLGKTFWLCERCFHLIWSSMPASQNDARAAWPEE